MLLKLGPMAAINGGAPALICAARRVFQVGFRATFTALLFLLACQAGVAQPSAPVRPQVPTIAPGVPDFPDGSPAERAAYDEREFLRHLNELLRLLNDFAVTYKAGVVDVKTVKAVRKALHELEKSEWFKRERTVPGAAPDGRPFR